MPCHHNLDEYFIGSLDGDGLGDDPKGRCTGTMGRGTGKLTRLVLKRTEELRGHPPVDMEGALSASAHSEGRGPTRRTRWDHQFESALLQRVAAREFPETMLVLFFLPFRR